MSGRFRSGAKRESGEFQELRISVPGNLLLLGEYAVLEEGGLGIALAVGRRVTIRARPADTFAFSRSDGAPPGDLPAAVAEAFRAWALRRGIDPDCAAGSIEADSAALNNAEGGKLGYGSSAAVAVGISAALLSLSVYPPEEETDGLRFLREAAYGIALDGHRSFQGGKGSGYDVAVSSFGGPILFRGGARPSWRRIALPWLPAIYVFRGRAPVSTADAIRRYVSWKQENPGKAARFFRDSNAAIEDFASCSSWREAVRPFRRYRELVLNLGREIGVPAEIEPPSEMLQETLRAGDAAPLKALGAGNELGAFFHPVAAGRQPGEIRIPGCGAVPFDGTGIVVERIPAEAER